MTVRKNMLVCASILQTFQEDPWQTRLKVVRTQFAVVLLSPTANSAARHAKALATPLNLTVIVVTRSVAEIFKTRIN